jgi:hypothetical protein
MSTTENEILSYGRFIKFCPITKKKKITINMVGVKDLRALITRSTVSLRMSCRVVWYKITGVSEERTASISMAEE